MASCIVRARTGHGKPGKPWNFEKLFSRPGMSWNFDLAHGKSWKMKIIALKHGSIYF